MSLLRVHAARAHAVRVCAAALLLSAAPSHGTPAQSSEPRVIEVLASRYAFEPATIDVRVGERVRLVMKSADGVHGLEIKKFKVKKEIPRGTAAVTVEFTAVEAGSFPILFSEYCGEGHEEMKGTLVVRAAGPVP